MQLTPNSAFSRTWARCQILDPSPITASSETSALSATTITGEGPFSLSTRDNEFHLSRDAMPSRQGDAFAGLAKSCPHRPGKGQPSVRKFHSLSSGRPRQVRKEWAMTLECTLV